MDALFYAVVPISTLDSRQCFIWWVPIELAISIAHLPQAHDRLKSKTLIYFLTKRTHYRLRNKITFHKTNEHHATDS